MSLGCSFWHGFFPCVPFSNSLLHGERPLPGNLLPGHNPGLDDEEDSGHEVGDGPDEGQAEGPAQVVVLPVRHEVAVVAQSAENDQRDRRQQTCKGSF